MTSHSHRTRRLDLLMFGLGESFAESPYLTPEARRETLEGTQFGSETHRLCTPSLQTMLMPDTRSTLMANLDTACEADRNKQASEVGTFDVAIIGSGPHGVAVACTLRERYPTLRTVMIENGKRLGGHWRNYGKKAVFRMNSRVRRADHRLPAIPRTPGSINPLGRYATLELSDFVQGNYAWNTDMGDACAINGFVNVDMALVDTKVTNVIQAGTVNMPRVFLNDGSVIKVKVVVDATGPKVPVVTKGMSPVDVYRHFATDPMPLAMFADKTVIIVGAGDSALTCMEALLGNLPATTYGAYGVGRLRPKKIIWVGAPSSVKEGIERCLRSRYKDGIVQALSKRLGDGGELITPTMLRARRIGEKQVSTDGGGVLNGDIVINCTNLTPSNRTDTNQGFSGPNIVKVGVASDAALPNKTINIIRNLGIKENTVSLWALMQMTDNAAMNVGQRASK